MGDVKHDCILCCGADGDAALQRMKVWEDGHWRLTVSLFAEVPGFSYLEPKRHIPHITDLDGEEARTLGNVLARITSALREATGAELVYVYVFGDGVPHLHIHLAPHRQGDALNSQMIKGDLVAEETENGIERIVSEEYPPLPEEDQRAVARRVRGLLAK